MKWFSFGKKSAPTTASQPTELAVPAVAPNAKKILVVDDDAVILKTTAAKLKGQGYQVFTAIDASEAMSATREHKPDLILLDICFPPDVGVDWDGLKIMNWLQRFEEGKNTPIVIVSGSEPEKYRERCLATGAAAFFYKPVKYEELLPFIAKMLKNQNDQPVPGA